MLEIGFSRFTRNLLQRTYRLVANNILEEYNLPTGDTPVTTDRESNIVAALRNSVRVDCACHRLHVSEIIVERHEEQVTDAASYETAVSDLCRYVKQATAIQEWLPKSLKHGGDTRSWTSMYRRAESVEASYESLVVNPRMIA